MWLVMGLAKFFGLEWPLIFVAVTSISSYIQVRRTVMISAGFRISSE
jgi:hypothetical protein